MERVRIKRKHGHEIEKTNHLRTLISLLISLGSKPKIRYTLMVGQLIILGFKYVNVWIIGFQFELLYMAKDLSEWMYWPFSIET